MNLQEQITADLKTAMLARESESVSVLRMLNAEIKNAAIASGQALDESQLVQLIRKEIKKRKETAAAYIQAGSTDRAASEESEAILLEKYLPPAVDSALVEAFLKQEASKLGTLEPKHRGELIRAAMQQFSGQVDGKVVSDLVSQLFS
jgi:uncharacterized protein YqeY